MLGPHVIEVAVEARAKVGRPRLVEALTALAGEDPSYRVSIDPESGQIILKGISELQLDAAFTKLKTTCGIDVNIGAPQVAYRETLTRRVDKDYTYKSQSGGAGQFARVVIAFAPDAVGGFEPKILGGAVPDAFVSGVGAGIESAMRSGVLAGFPVVGVKATLTDGAYHDKDSSALTFEIAARAACRDALREGGPVLLEPIMAVEVTMPEAYLGFVIGDLRARRGIVRAQDMRADVVVLEGFAPLANLFGYANQLHSGTQGHGSFTSRFSHYAPAPPPAGGDGPAAPAMAL